MLCAEPIIDVDTTAADVLSELVEELQSHNIEFALAEIKTPVREHIARYGLVDLIGEQNIYPTIGSAVHAYVRTAGVDWVDWQDVEESGATED